MRAILKAARALRRRYAPTIDDVVFDRHPWHPDAPEPAATIPMVIGTCRTELSLQLGMMDPTTYDITDDDLPDRLRSRIRRRRRRGTTRSPVRRTRRRQRPRCTSLVTARGPTGGTASSRRSTKPAGRGRWRTRVVVPHHLADPDGGRAQDLTPLDRSPVRVRQRADGVHTSAVRRLRRRPSWPTRWPSPGWPSPEPATPPTPDSRLAALRPRHKNRHALRRAACRGRGSTRGHPLAARWLSDATTRAVPRWLTATARHPVRCTPSVSST